MVLRRQRRPSARATDRRGAPGRRGARAARRSLAGRALPRRAARRSSRAPTLVVTNDSGPDAPRRRLGRADGRAVRAGDAGHVRTDRGPRGVRCSGRRSAARASTSTTTRSLNCIRGRPECMLGIGVDDVLATARRLSAARPGAGSPLRVLAADDSRAAAWRSLMRVLLLNPPGRAHLHPRLLLLEDDEVELPVPSDRPASCCRARSRSRTRSRSLDAIAERLSTARGARPHRRASPRRARLARRLRLLARGPGVSCPRKRPAGRRVLAIGDVLHEDAEKRLAEEPWIEAAVHVFANAGRAPLPGRPPRRDRGHERARRAGGALPDQAPGAREGVSAVPRPRHELFPDARLSLLVRAAQRRSRPCSPTTAAPTRAPSA